MVPTESEVWARARRAYELGRVRAGLRVGLFVVPMTVVAAPVCGAPVTAAVLGAALYAITAGLIWRGEEYGEAAGVGLLAGTAPLLLALVLRSGGHPCVRDFCWTANLPLLVGGGLVAGAAVALRATRVARRRAAFVAASALVAGITGSLGCVFGGVAGLLGMAAGLLAGSSPAAVWTLLRRRAGP
jgi:hypothetical protein